MPQQGGTEQPGVHLHVWRPIPLAPFPAREGDIGWKGLRPFASIWGAIHPNVFWQNARMRRMPHGRAQDSPDVRPHAWRPIPLPPSPIIAVPLYLHPVAVAICVTHEARIAAGTVWLSRVTLTGQGIDGTVRAVHKAASFQIVTPRPRIAYTPPGNAWERLREEAPRRLRRTHAGWLRRIFRPAQLAHRVAPLRVAQPCLPRRTGRDHIPAPAFLLHSERPRHESAAQGFVGCKVRRSAAPAAAGREKFARFGKDALERLGTRLRRFQPVRGGSLSRPRRLFRRGLRERGRWRRGLRAGFLRFALSHGRFCRFCRVRRGLPRRFSGRAFPVAAHPQSPQRPLQGLDRAAIQRTARTLRAEDFAPRRIRNEEDHRRVDTRRRPPSSAGKLDAHCRPIQPGKACGLWNGCVRLCTRAQCESNVRPIRTGQNMCRTPAHAVKSDDAFRFPRVHAAIPFLSSNHVYDAQGTVCYNECAASAKNRRKPPQRRI